MYLHVSLILHKKGLKKLIKIRYFELWLNINNETGPRQKIMSYLYLVYISKLKTFHTLVFLFPLYVLLFNTHSQNLTIET